MVGPPVARWAGSRGFQSLVDSARRCKRSAGLAYSRFGSALSNLAYTRFASGETPRHRDAVRPRYPPRLASWRSSVFRSPEPDELSPAGVSFESLRFGNRAR
jgi:hypothetical protein